DGPPEDLPELGRHAIGGGALSGLGAAGHDARLLPSSVVVGEQQDRSRQEHFLLHGGQRATQARRGLAVRGAPRGHGQPRVDEERAHPRDVQQLAADGVLDLAPLAMVDPRADRRHREHRDGSEQHGQAQPQALPRAERGGGAVSAGDRRGARSRWHGRERTYPRRASGGRAGWIPRRDGPTRRPDTRRSGSRRASPELATWPRAWPDPGSAGPSTRSRRWSPSWPR